MTNQRRFSRSFLSFALAVVMLLSIMPTSVLAEEIRTDVDIGGLCEHHLAHDRTVCGYIAEAEGQECTHIHDETCYTEATVDSPATDSNAEEKILNCQHSHDDNCEYVEAVEGEPCTFKCDQCNSADIGENVSGVSNVIVTAFDELAQAVKEQTVPAKTPLADLNLPDSLQAIGYTIADDTVILDSGETSVSPTAITIGNITWEVNPAHELNMGIDSYDEQAEQGAYCFTPILPEGYAPAEGVKLPEITVVVGGVNRLINEPIVIKTAEDLLNMNLGISEHTGTHYLLANDINLNQYNWSGITIDLSKRPDKTLIFDGNGHKITGLNLGSDVNKSGLGLFGDVVSTGTMIVKNLDVRVESISTRSVFLGAIVGDSAADITLINCKGYINQTNLPKTMTGASLVGLSRGNIILQQCYGNMGLVVRCDGNFYAEECGATGSTYNLGAYTENDQPGMMAAGIIQTCIGNADLVNCFALYPGTPTLSSGHCFSGGLIEYVAGNVSLTNCYASYSPNFERQEAGALIGCIDYSSNSILLNSTYYNEDIAVPVGGSFIFLTGIHAIGIRGNYYPEIHGTLPNPGKSQIEMKKRSTYEGWDFTNVWSISPNINNGFPTLKALQLSNSEYPQFNPPINPPDPSTSISVSPLTMTLKIDETKNLTIATLPDGLQYTCVSSNPEIAIVTSEGFVTAKKEGSATITVSLVDTPSEKALCTVTVLPAEPYDDLMCAIVASQLAYENALTGFDFGGTVAQFADAAIDPSRKLWESKADIRLADFYKDVLGEWKIVGVQSYSSGLFAIALYDAEQNKTIMAFRGTETPKDVTTDVLMGIANALTAQFSDALQFYENHKGSGGVLLTGHSLGGSLAAHVSMNTGVRAEVFNAAIGWSLAGTYAQQAEEVFQNFTGIDQWNFVNHATDSSSGTASANVNKLVAFKYAEKLPMRIYDVSATGMGDRLNIHDLNSMLEYDEQNRRFEFSPSSPWGNTSGTLQEFPPLAFGDLYTFGTSSADTVLRYASTGLITSTRILGGDGNDQLTTNQGGSDWLVSGTGSNALDGGAWNDSYFLIPCDGTQIINDPSGLDTIYLPSGVRVTNQVQSGEYIIANLSNGQAIQANVKRDFLAPAIKICSMDGTDCGKLEIKTRAGRTAVRIPVTTIEIDGNATVTILDGLGNTIGTIDTASDTFPRYENYGYFYLDEQGQHMSAILFNGAYQLEISSTGLPIDYTIMRHAEDDSPLTRVTATQIALESGDTLKTQTTFDSERTVPMAIEKSNGAEVDVSYTVEDLTEIGGTSAVTGVLVTPKRVNVEKGATQNFSAIVTGTGNYNTAVHWNVSGGGSGTRIDSNGKLTIAANEAAALLTVTATSVQDSSKIDTSAVSITDKPNVPLYRLTVSGSYVQNSGEGVYGMGAKVPVDAGTKEGHSFSGWTSAGGGAFADKDSRSTTFTMPGNDVTIVANWSSNGGGSTGGNTSGGGGGSSSDKPAAIAPTPTRDKMNPPIVGEITVDATVDTDGNATMTVTDKSIIDAIHAAKRQAGQNGISITINVILKQMANSLTTTLSDTALDKLIGENVKELKISSGLVSMSFNLEALKEIQKSVTGNLIIMVKKLDVKTLSAAAQTTIENRPVFDLAMTIGDKAITSFGKGTASVWIPYRLTANELAGNVQAVYVDNKGAISPIVDSSYDQTGKAVMFITNHFSVYGVGYMQNTPKFIDIASHWAKNDIEFVVAKGLLSGTSNTAFSPNTAMTRGMFVTALGRLSGIDTSSYKSGSFTDVKADAYYAPYVNWVAKKGITTGTTATTFAPDQTVTRQEMAVFMQNYAKTMGYTVPKTRTAVTFADNSSIGSWAAEAVKSMQMAGVIMGKDGNCFDPTGTATRAEVSAVLHRYVELVIDRTTAQGLDVNDSGKIIYYENGKLFTGTKTIDGTTYHFGTDGICIKIDAVAPDTQEYAIHKTIYGETLWDIAMKNKCTVAEIVGLNGIVDPNNVPVGTKLKIPQK